MNWTLVALLFVLSQDPEPQEAVKYAVIELVGGGQIEGELVVDTPLYVEVRVGGGSIVGFERSRVLRVREDVAPPTEAIETEKAKERAPELAPSAASFVLHDATGRVVGKVERSVATDDSGHVRISEEWEFRQDRQSTQLTKLEVVTRELSPISCFYHERLREDSGDRTVRDHLVNCEVRGDRLVVDSRDMTQREHNEYPVPDGMQFPMAATLAMRQRAMTDHEPSATIVFDPARRELVNYSVSSGGLREVEWRDDVVMVRELRYDGGIGVNTEWLDAKRGVVRREINGPELVAVPVAASAVGRYLESNAPVFAPALVTEPDSRFGFWLPNPTWRVAQTDPGWVTADNPMYGASACLATFEQIDRGVLLETAADTVFRWLRMARPGFEIAQRGPHMIRGRASVRAVATYQQVDASGPVAFECHVYVFAVRGRYMALCLSAPVAKFAELATDFERIRDSLELHAGALKEHELPRSGL